MVMSVSEGRPGARCCGRLVLPSPEIGRGRPGPGFNPCRPPSRRNWRDRKRTSGPGPGRSSLTCCARTRSTARPCAASSTSSDRPVHFHAACETAYPIPIVTSAMHVVAEAFLEILRIAEGRALLVPGPPPDEPDEPNEPVEPWD